MFYAAFGLIWLALLSVCLLAGIGLIAWASRNLRRELGGRLMLGSGIVLVLIPALIMASSFLPGQG